MKKIILPIGIALLLNYANAQETNCVNGVSTNHNNPTNNSLPTNSPNPSYGDLFLNKFDWFPVSPSGLLNGYVTDNMPFLSQNNNTMLHTHNDGMSSFYNYLQSEVFSNLWPTHENGWELLAVNLGYYPNMEPFENSNVDFNSTNTNQTKPYIILYNKFLGKIRIHAKVGEEWATENYWQSIRVNLVVNGKILGENYNGMLRLLDGIDKPLDQETTVREYTALCEANNVKNQWFVAEFQVAFDPCVCK